MNITNLSANPDPSISWGDDYFMPPTFESGTPACRSPLPTRALALLTRLLRRASRPICGDPILRRWGAASPRRRASFDLHRCGATPGHRRRAIEPLCCVTSQLPGDGSTNRWRLVGFIYLNSGGFDPSLFHDDDGRKYLNMLWDHRSDRIDLPALCSRNITPSRS